MSIRPTGTAWGCGAAPGAKLGAESLSATNPLGCLPGLAGRWDAVLPGARRRAAPAQELHPVFLAAEHRVPAVDHCHRSRSRCGQLAGRCCETRRGDAAAPGSLWGRRKGGLEVVTCPGETCQEGKPHGCCPAARGDPAITHHSSGAVENCLPVRGPWAEGQHREPRLLDCPPAQRGAERPPFPPPSHPRPHRTAPPGPTRGCPGSTGAHRARGPRPG